MRKFSFLAVALAATVFASCSKENNGNTPDGESTSVSVTMSTGTADGLTRSQGEAVDVSDPVSFLGGYLYFAAGGQITNRVQIITTGSPDNENTVLYSTLTTTPGATLKNIKSHATNVFFVGNVPSGVTLPSSGNMADVWSKLAGIETQADATGGVVNVSLYGTGTVDTPVGWVDGDPKESAFRVYPIVARVQVPFFVIDPAVDNVVTGFQIDGIFINNFYHHMSLNGAPAAAQKIAYTSSSTWEPDGEIYYGDGTTPGTPDYTGVTFDYATAGGLGDFDAVATDEYYADPADHDQMWVYNLFAGNQTTKAEANRIVIKFSNITTSDGSTFADPQYITVKGINNGATLADLTGGKIYTFTAGIPIHAKYFTEIPEVDPIDVLCDITIMPWEDESVTPEF